jgi:uncharacterized membrane protein YeiH
MPSSDHFQLPVAFEFSAVFLLAITGALLAIEDHYDVVGVFVLALLTAVGGGLLRDTFFLQRGVPLVLQDERYFYAVALATTVCLIVGAGLNRLTYVFLLADALGLGIYAVVGTQHALDFGLHFVPAGVVGLANAVGGGVLRDVLTGKETLLFRPGEFYILAAVGGTAVFLALLLWAGVPAQQAAGWSIATTVLIRLAAVSFNWKTRAARPLLSHRPADTR